MSAKILRAARPLFRPLATTAAFRGPFVGVAGRQRLFATTVARQGVAGNRQEPRRASTWSMSGVFAVAATAGIVGWGASELRHGGFPGTMLLDGGFLAPRYASMREMEQVCYTSSNLPLTRRYPSPPCVSSPFRRLCVPRRAHRAAYSMAYTLVGSGGDPRGARGTGYHLNGSR